ncbi:MAG: Uncharacterized protein G01um101433_162 [Parcubacteria group bacterium Gr01-1014_33]|nr:MAG: Uncharacterized protein G01um101433_162 [Parcubacteria group bacterium Gr01-1014_33]
MTKRVHPNADKTIFMQRGKKTTDGIRRRLTVHAIRKKDHAENETFVPEPVRETPKKDLADIPTLESHRVAEEKPAHGAPPPVPEPEQKPKGSALPVLPEAKPVQSHAPDPSPLSPVKPVFAPTRNTFSFGREPVRGSGAPAKPHSILYPEENEKIRAKILARESPRRLLWMGMLAAVLMVSLGMFLLSTQFNRMNVIVKMKRENLLLQDVSITIDANVSEVLPEKGVIPGEYLTFSKTIREEFPSSGRAHVEEKSKGRVKIYNAFSSSPQSLVSRTRFITDTGKVYRLANGVEVPGAKIANGKIVPQFVEADLASDAPGEDMNVSGEITLRIVGFQDTPKYDVFYAIAPSGFAGGFKGEAAIVLGSDIAHAEETVTKKAYEALEADIGHGIPSGFTFVNGLKEIEILKVDAPAEKTPGERLSVKADAEARIFVFRKEEVMRFLSSALLKGDESRELVENSEELTYRVRLADFKNKQATIALAGNVKAEKTLNQKELAETLKGKKEGTLLNFLKTRDEFSSFRLAFFPPWLFSAPSDPSKIRFTVERE